MKPVQRIFLVGLMGSGKTTVAPLLAARLRWTWADLDGEVERRMGLPVAALFAERGEAAFRRAEAAALAEAAVRPRVVVATGGGVFTDPANRALAKAAGRVLYLRASPEALAARLAGDTSRPLLLDWEGQPLAPEGLTARLAALLAARQAAYHEADAVVETTGRTPAEVVEAALFALRRGD